MEARCLWNRKVSI